MKKRNDEKCIIQPNILIIFFLKCTKEKNPVHVREKNYGFSLKFEKNSHSHISDMLNSLHELNILCYTVYN